ncbi:MAG: hypothetical protein AABX93_00920 [Nanoarchaeota archaeon]
MSELRRALEKRLEKMIPKAGDDLFRRRMIKEYALIFDEKFIPEMLKGEKPIYYDAKEHKYVYLPE